MLVLRVQQPQSVVRVRKLSTCSSSMASAPSRGRAQRFIGHRAQPPTSSLDCYIPLAIEWPGYFERQGFLVRDPESEYLDLDPGEAFDQLVGASIHYRIAIGPNAGKKALMPRTVAAQPQPPSRERLRSNQRSPPRDARPGSCGKRPPGATLRPPHEYPPLRAAFPRLFRLQSPPSHPQPAHHTPLTTSHERSFNQSYFATIPSRAVIRPIRYYD